MASGESEQALEGGHRSPAAVEAELELTEVDRHVLGADAVVGSGQPSLEIREDAVDAWEDVARISLPALDFRLVVVAEGYQTLVAAEAVREHRAPFDDIGLDESLERDLRRRRGDRQPHSTRSLPPDLDRADDEDLSRRTAP